MSDTKKTPIISFACAADRHGDACRGWVRPYCECECHGGHEIERLRSQVSEPTPDVRAWIRESLDDPRPSLSEEEVVARVCEPTPAVTDEMVEAALQSYWPNESFTQAWRNAERQAFRDALTAALAARKP